MVKVLFVCLGNICRSPTAEGVFRDLVHREGLSDKIETDSCGTGAWHTGDPPDDRAQQEAKRRGINIADLKARKFEAIDFETFDYILAMDDSNHRDLCAAAPDDSHERIHLMMSFASGAWPREVPDPYYGGADGFRNVFDMIEAASAGLLADIRQRHIGDV